MPVGVFLSSSPGGVTGPPILQSVSFLSSKLRFASCARGTLFAPTRSSSLCVKKIGRLGFHPPSSQSKTPQICNLARNSLRFTPPAGPLYSLFTFMETGLCFRFFGPETPGAKKGGRTLQCGPYDRPKRTTISSVSPDAPSVLSLLF